jgi:hypothetical protein
MKKITLALWRLTVLAIINLGRNILAQMTANADTFTAPPVTMAALGNALTNLETAQQAMVMGGRAATIHRDEMQAVVRDMLTKLANYVETVADGNPDIITLAGMLPKRQGPVRYDSLTQPQNLKVKTGLEGQVVLRWEKVDHAKSYQVEYSTDPLTADSWRMAMISSSSRAEVSGLISVRKYWFRVRATGTQGMVSVWSDPAMIVVV